MLIIQTYIKELKYLLYYILISITLTTIVIYTYNYEILYIISKPLIGLNTQQFNFIFTNIFEAFKTYIFLSIFMGIHLNLPFIA
jgi:sec-independent protein translocase protein TatC